MVLLVTNLAPPMGVSEGYFSANMGADAITQLYQLPAESWYRNATFFAANIQGLIPAPAAVASLAILVEPGTGIQTLLRS